VNVEDFAVRGRWFPASRSGFFLFFFLFLSGVSHTMKWFLRVSAPALLGFAVFGLAGCGEDNEKTAMKLAPTNSGPVDTSKAAPPPSSYDEYAKRQTQSQQGSLKKSGYPGAK
jgi:hypothetical protein